MALGTLTDCELKEYLDEQIDLRCKVAEGCKVNGSDVLAGYDDIKDILVYSTEDFVRISKLFGRDVVCEDTEEGVGSIISRVSIYLDNGVSIHTYLYKEEVELYGEVLGYKVSA